jgi:hypothetical protein
VEEYRTATLLIIDLEAGEHPSVLAVCHSFMSLGLAARQGSLFIPRLLCLMRLYVMVSGDMA